MKKILGYIIVAILLIIAFYGDSQIAKSQMDTNSVIENNNYK